MENLAYKEWKAENQAKIAWESKKQVDQALSSVESEYMALFRAIREVVWPRRLLAELGEEQQGPTPLYCDSQGSIGSVASLLGWL
ncbi:hypothetical protein CLOM_g943 [Closterium sp. NIES-68]|nr:hypothetical protein CLOM_g943 [Closterium sp. NIES-68]